MKWAYLISLEFLEKLKTDFIGGPSFSPTAFPRDLVGMGISSSLCA